MDAPRPAREVTLVGEARASRDFRQAGSPVANELDRALQPQMHYITVRGHANGSGEHARELERATPGDVGKSGDLDGLVQMRQNVVPEPTEHVFAQRTSGRVRWP